jgi:hypothetical protein
MVVNDMNIGYRAYTGAVWISSFYGYQSVDSDNYTCSRSFHKVPEFYKRVLRVALDGRIVIERMTSKNGGCVGDSGRNNSDPSIDSNHPAGISDDGYTMAQYFVCQLNQD